MNVGVSGVATGLIGTYNIGAEGFSNNSLNTNFGVVGVANTNLGDLAGYFDGNVYGTESFYDFTGIFTTSDSTIKTKVNSFSNAISIIKKLQPKTYYYDTNNIYKNKLDTFMHYGFIAQQVQRVTPCLVRTISTPPKFDTGMHILAQNFFY